MGKATLYHPVSLTVVRAAAIQCGWKFGKIIQTASNEVSFTASYIAEVDLERKGYILVEKSELIHQISECFADDVIVEDVWTTKSGRVLVQFMTILYPNNLPGFGPGEEPPTQEEVDEHTRQIFESARWLA